MIIKSVLLALVLSQPTVTPDMLDMTYKPCVEAYNYYIEVNSKDVIKGAVVGENVKYLCTPIKYERQDQ